MDTIFNYHPLAKFVIENLNDEITKVEEAYNLKTESLKLYLALHIFKYSLEEIFNKKEHYKKENLNIPLILKELEFLALNILENNHLYEEMNRESGYHNQKTYLKKSEGKILELSEINKELVSEIFFGEVDEKTGYLIQDELHYIKNRREDTLFHFGLFRNKCKKPFVYSAFSLLNRDYLSNLPYFKKIDKKHILVKTRAFGFKNCPKNSMSTLYTACMDYFKKKTEYKICITAINSNLLFSAQSFLGSSYFPIASVPIDYFYINGIYSPRRKIEVNKEEKKLKITEAKTIPYPIFWLARGITKEMILYIEKSQPDIGIIKITKEEYQRK